jgi:hypothetical protein
MRREENMNKKIVYTIVAAILVISVCSITGYNYRYNISPCDAIDISLTDVRVVAFLDRTDMATVNVYNCEYKGYNTWLVCWYTETQSQRVYVDIYTGEIIGTAPEPEPSWHTLETFQGRHDKVTPIFTIKGDTWRMNWKTIGHENESSISVTVYKDLLFPTFVDGFSGNNYPFSDTYYVYDGSGTYNLDILAHELEYYSITVEDYY